MRKASGDPVELYDDNGMGNVRAKSSSPGMWLVWGDDFDTCGAVKKIRGRYEAWQRGSIVGECKTLREAVIALLSPDSKRTFLGGK